MPSRLPLFPLKLVLFPGESLPLLIFEPRYRQLLADCLAGDKRFGITADLEPGPGALGCSAIIQASQLLPDGRSAIVVVGERRFAVRARLDEGKPYLVGAIDGFEDQPGTAPLPEERCELRVLGEAARMALRILADATTDLEPWPMTRKRSASRSVPWSRPTSSRASDCWHSDRPASGAGCCSD